MLNCRVLTIKGYEHRKAYTINELEKPKNMHKWEEFRRVIHQYETKKYNGFITFDIETSRYTRIDEQYESFLYIWQVAINDEIVIFGRNWKEYNYLLSQLRTNDNNKKLVIYVHNLSYEFQFMKNFIEFDEVFATDRHEILKASNSFYEFRCSYKLSNMTLSKFIENTEEHYLLKAVDDLDYRKLRTPSQAFQMSVTELGYCYNDVAVLYQAIKSMLNEDTLQSIKMTSTGFVRRDCYKSCRDKKSRQWFKDTKMSLEEYQQCKKAFRGGNTASNRFYTSQIMKDVSSFDISSSYPYVMLTKKYPSSNWMHLDPTIIESFSDIDFYNYNNNFCTVATYTFFNISLKDLTEPIPYISNSKCDNINNYLAYNGRVTNADTLTITCTNVDYKIILDMYEFESVYVSSFMYCKARKLPKPLRKTILEYFYKKSTLKGVEGSEYEYGKSKNKLNSTFGMFVSDILHDSWQFQYTSKEIERIETNKEEKVEKLKKYYNSRNSFLPYQVGIFITAYARERLQEGLNLVGDDVVYTDTDSIKYVGDHEKDFIYLNKQVEEEKRKIEENGEVAFWVEDKKISQCMGLWDKEKGYSEFITMGAKKYAYIQNGKIGVTVSGLNKKNAPKELEKLGGLEHFKKGQVFYNSGRTASEFIDNEKTHILKIGDEEIENGSYLNIYDVTYTLGITDHNNAIIENPELFIKMYKKMMLKDNNQ